MQEPNNEWPTPPLPEKIAADEPQMSEAATLGNIFFDPGSTFEDLRRKPRFLFALLILAVLITAFGLSLNAKIGEERYRVFFAEQVDKSPQSASMTAEQKESAVNLNMMIAKVATYGTPVLVAIIFAIGGLLYWLGSKAFGGTGNYLHGLSTFVYSSFPPTVIAMFANLTVLFLKSADDIDLAASQRGVIQANLSGLLDGKAMPVLTTLVSTLDIFAIWGWILAAIGLRITNKISAGSAWAITLIFALLGITFRVLGALMSGNPS